MEMLSLEKELKENDAEKLFYEIYAKQAKRLTKKSNTSAEKQ